MPDSSFAPSDHVHADVGIVCALPIELAAFMDRCQHVKKYTGGDFHFRGGFYDGIRVAVVESGMGFARARRATQALLDGHAPRWLLSCGFAGALQPDIPIGSIVVADSIVDQHGHTMQIDLHMPADPAHGLFVGRLLTADEVVRAVALKKQLAEQHGALAVDLESLAVAQVAKENKVRFLAVRVISDDLSHDLPPEILSVVGATGSVRLGAAIGALWKRPAAAKDLWNLREKAHAAATRLATFLDGVVVQLHAATKSAAEGK
jgi:adenosylhomocysteine nucleosidase